MQEPEPRPLPILTTAGVEQWRGLVAQYPWDVTTVLRIMQCESGGDPTATGGPNYGLMQVNAVHSARVGGNLSALYDPATNIRVAYDIYVDGGGFGPWSCWGG